MHQHSPGDHLPGDHSHGDHSPEMPAPPIGVHGMLLVGNDPIYLSHLPMFMAPHNYQAILRVSLDGKASSRLKDFQAHFGRDFLYTVKPEEFSIVDLLPVGDAEPVVRTFTADVVKGHFEKGGDPITEGATVTVHEVTHFDELGNADSKPADLEYILFGNGPQFFLAHRITVAPDFDHVVSVNISGAEFTEAELSRERSGVTVTFDGRSNSPDERLKAGQTLGGRGHVIGAHQFQDLQVEVLTEIYFEEGELQAQATFDPTAEEQSAGFGE